MGGGAELYTALAALKSLEGRESEAAVLIKVPHCLIATTPTPFSSCTSVPFSSHADGAH